MKIHCRTLFDCTHTGVTGSFRPSNLPFQDQANQNIDSAKAWERSRNQQRNYETLMQLFGLRTQPMNVSVPQQIDGAWEFTFESESDGVFASGQDDLAALRSDCEGVPMTLGLSETVSTVPKLTTQGSQQNIWFSL